jgi:HEAT repeat protein
MHVRDVLSRAGSLTWLTGLVLLFTAFGPARAQQPDVPQSDAVRALGEALLQPLPLPDPNDKDWAEKALKERKSRLTAAADRLTDLGDMAQALLLPTWGDERPSLTEGPDPSKVDREVRQALLQRFITATKKAIQTGTESGDPSLREAVATLVGEFAISARSSTLGSRAGNRLLIEGLPTIAETIATLAKTDKSPEVRAGAVRALAKLRAAPDVTMAAAEALLKDNDPTVRRAAAGALSGSGEVSGVLRGSPAAGRGGTVVTVEPPTREEIVQFGSRIARTAGAVLTSGESDVVVRRRCAEALANLAQLVVTQVQVRSTEASAELHRALQPVIAALWDQTGALSAAARDPDPGTRQAALRALEEMGEIRRRWLHPEEFSEPDKLGPGTRKPEVVPPPEKTGELNLTYAAEQAAPPKPAKGEPAALAAAIPALVRDLGAPDVRTRLAAIDALEMVTAHGRDQTAAQELGKEPAADAAKALTRALYDRDRFVRWAAARTLGKMAPLDNVENGKEVEHAAVAGLAWLLSDPNPDVRLRVAYALERFGKAAGDAVPALAVAASRGDDEARIGAAHAIEVIGGSAAEAVPALAVGLDSPNTRLRRAVAQALGQYGAQARAARPALQRALRDTDPDVRRLASDALVKIGTAK